MLGLKKNKEVPSELPDLISDEIEKESLGEVAEPVKEIIQEAPKEVPVESTQATKNIEDYRAGTQENKAILEGINEDIGTDSSLRQNQVLPQEQTVSKEIQRQVTSIIPSKYSSEKSFFNDMQENLEKEILNMESVENWDDSKFSSRDMLEDMRSYWRKQKTPSIMESLGRNFQSKISEKIQTLQSLERGWQNTYFELIEKEEEIKDAERELKKMLKEFVKICKHKKDSLENEKTKDKEENSEEAREESEPQEESKTKN